jgi:hypothetical protein
MASKKMNPKRSTRAKKAKLLIISGGELAEPSAPLLLPAYDLIDKKFGWNASATPDPIEKLGWIDDQGHPLVDRAPNELLCTEIDPAYLKPLKLFDQLGPRAIELGLRRVEGEIPGYLFDHVAYSGTAEQLQEALTQAGINVEVHAHLFTRSEHHILSSWLGVYPNEAQESLGAAFAPARSRYFPSWEAEEAAKKLITGYGEGRSVDAAVATILLRSIERNLPNWGVWSPETGTLLARNSPAHRDSRKLHLMPAHLFTINWASSGPGFSWPNQYNLTWVPLYEEYVVTVSADSPEGLAGYTDLALGSFKPGGDVEDYVCSIVVSDWDIQVKEWNQERWEYVVEPALISTETLKEWAGHVWNNENDDRESD